MEKTPIADKRISEIINYYGEMYLYDARPPDHDEYLAKLIKRIDRLGGLIRYDKTSHACRFLHRHDRVVASLNGWRRIVVQATKREAIYVKVEDENYYMTNGGTDIRGKVIWTKVDNILEQLVNAMKMPGATMTILEYYDD